MSQAVHVHYGDQTGFSLLELVVGVAITLVLAVVGFIGFQDTTDNARQAAVERAADDVFTAVMASQTLPAHRATSMDDIVAQYNETAGDDITVTARHADDDLTVKATGWNDRFTAIRTTAASAGERIPIENVSKELVEEDDELVWEWTENDYSEGIFRFTTSKANSALNLGGLTDGATITHEGTGNTWALREGLNDLPHSGTYTVHGGFRNIGPEVSFLNQNEWKNQYPEYSRKLGDILMQQIFQSPFATGSASSVDVWENTGTVDISYAFAVSLGLEHVATPPSTVKNMEGVFYGANNFNQDLSDWDVSNVTNMMSMFYEARSFEHDISTWNVANVDHYDDFAFYSPLSGSQNLPKFE